MRFYRIRLTSIVSIIGLLLASMLTMHAQGITTAAISGFVTGADGKPISGATIKAIHEPSGTTATTTTRPNGQFDLSNLRIGGPYTVTIAGKDLTAEPRKDVYLSLGETQDVSFDISAGEVVKLESFKVSESRDVTFGSGKISTGSSFDVQQVENLASVRRNIQDLIQIDSRVVVMSLDQGQNFRFNSFLIDGVQANDPYGLNGNGFSSLRSPIPLEAIASTTVDLNPLDIRRSGFTGALVNVVTKSGTNSFSGSSYIEYTDKNMRAKNPITDARESFTERTYGLAAGGPIVPSKVFFFVAYDNFRRISSPPTPNFVLSGPAVQQITDRAKVLGYDPGSFTAVNLSTQKTYLAKLDWNINQDHRFSYTFRKNEGSEPSFPNFTSSTTTSFGNYWFDQPRITNSYTFQLFSKWSDDFRTEAFFAQSNYDGSPKNRASAFPEVQIKGVSGTRVDTGAAINNGTVYLGTEYSRQLNQLSTKTTNGSFSGEYSMGDHKVLAGSDYQRTLILNKFVQYYDGGYTFNSLSDWLTGDNASLQRVALAPGYSTEDSFASYPYTVYSGYLQDTWKPNSRLTVQGGARIDYPYLTKKPVPIPTTANYSEQRFRDNFGVSSTTTNSGNYTIGPRLGFNYDLPTSRKTQLRAAAGLFQGSNPAVWLANAYQNRGVLAPVTSTTTFSPTPSTPSASASLPANALAVVNLTDPNFKSPVSWKGNLAIDHTLPNGWIVSAEAERIEVERGLMVTNLNLKPNAASATLPDGRTYYAGGAFATTNVSRGSNSKTYTNSANYLYPGFADVYYFTNTKRGGGHDFTLSIKRPMKQNWSTSLSWTTGHYTEVSPVTSSVAQSNYNARAIFNPNDDVDSTSNTNIKNKIVATLAYRLELIKKAPTTISLIYQGRTGHPYSWVYYGDVNGDGFTYNDLFYMPSGPNDSKVRWTASATPTQAQQDAGNAQRDAFFAFANAEGINKYSGSVVPRNSSVSRWVQTFDLKITQNIPIYKKVQTEVFLNVIDFANLFSKRWGLQEEVPFSYKRAIVGATYDAATKQYVYAYSTSGSSRTLDSQPITANDTPVSRWQLQTGMRVKF